MLTKQFITAGYAIFTVVPSEESRKAAEKNGKKFHEHYTYLVERVEFEATDKFPASVRYFVKSLTGPDNNCDYTYLGMLDAATGEVKLTAKSAFPETATRVQIIRRVLAAIFAGKGDAIAAAGWSVKHEGYCGRCGAMLTVPASVESGYGPECIKLVMGCSLAAWAKKNGGTVPGATINAA